MASLGPHIVLASVARTKRSEIRDRPRRGHPAFRFAPRGLLVQPFLATRDLDLVGNDILDCRVFGLGTNAVLGEKFVERLAAVDV